MKKKVIGYCPICNEKLFVKTLRCDHCDTEITGEFNLSPFDYLSKEELEFALVFIKCEGNIKEIEKSLNISYPTVKKNIDNLIAGLGFSSELESKTSAPTREEILERVKNGELTLDEAEELLGGF